MEYRFPIPGSVLRSLLDAKAKQGEKFSEEEAVADVMLALDRGQLRSPAWYAKRWKWSRTSTYRHFAGDAERGIEPLESRVQRWRDFRPRAAMEAAPETAPPPARPAPQGSPDPSPPATGEAEQPDEFGDGMGTPWEFLGTENPQNATESGGLGIFGDAVGTLGDGIEHTNILQEEEEGVVRTHAREGPPGEIPDTVSEEATEGASADASPDPLNFLDPDQANSYGPDIDRLLRQFPDGSTADVAYRSIWPRRFSASSPVAWLSKRIQSDGWPRTLAALFIATQAADRPNLAYADRVLEGFTTAPQQPTPAAGGTPVDALGVDHRRHDQPQGTGRRPGGTSRGGKPRGGSGSRSGDGSAEDYLRRNGFFGK